MSGTWSADGLRYERRGARGGFVWSARIVWESWVDEGWQLYRTERWSTGGQTFRVPAASEEEAKEWLRRYVERYEREEVEPRLAKGRKK